MRISDWSSDVCSSDLRRGRDVELDRCVDRCRQLVDRGNSVLRIDEQPLPVERDHFDLQRLRIRIDRTRRRRSEEHTSELQSLMRISYAVFCLKKKKTNETTNHTKTP